MGMPEVQVGAHFRRQRLVVVVPDEGDVAGEGVDVAAEVKAVAVVVAGVVVAGLQAVYKWIVAFILLPLGLLVQCCHQPIFRVILSVKS
jgi:hypothetical protein